MLQLSASIKDTVDKLFSDSSALRRERKLSLDSRNRNKKNGVVAWAAQSILVHNAIVNGVKSSLLSNDKLKKKNGQSGLLVFNGQSMANYNMN